MKKILLIAVLAVASLAAYAQPRAIGANLGTSLGFSYQHGFGEANMLDVSVYVPWGAGFATDKGGACTWGLGGTVTYDWIDPFNTSVPWDQKGEWHWYMGVGGSGGVYGFDKPTSWFVGAAGHFGIEYDFWFPLQLSVDYRPTLGIAGSSANGNTHVEFGKGGLLSGITIGVRYKF